MRLRDTFAENATNPEDRYKNFTSIGTMRGPTDGDYSMHSWCAHFIEVRVDEDFGTLRVSRVVTALDSGRLYNPKLAESQWQGSQAFRPRQAGARNPIDVPEIGKV